jgi:hypothetical protein
MATRTIPPAYQRYADEGSLGLACQPWYVQGNVTPRDPRLPVPVTVEAIEAEIGPDGQRCQHCCCSSAAAALAPHHPGGVHVDAVIVVPPPSPMHEVPQGREDSLWPDNGATAAQDEPLATFASMETASPQLASSPDRVAPPSPSQARVPAAIGMPTLVFQRISFGMTSAELGAAAALAPATAVETWDPLAQSALQPAAAGPIPASIEGLSSWMDLEGIQVPQPSESPAASSLGHMQQLLALSSNRGMLSQALQMELKHLVARVIHIRTAALMAEKEELLSLAQQSAVPPETTAPPESNTSDCSAQDDDDERYSPPEYPDMYPDEEEGEIVELPVISEIHVGSVETPSSTSTASVDAAGSVERGRSPSISRRDLHDHPMGRRQRDGRSRERMQARDGDSDRDRNRVHRWW